VSKDLKTSTRKLCRQLQENPDVQGNITLIFNYKKQLQRELLDVNYVMHNEQNFNVFRQNIKEQLDHQQEFEQLKETEKKLNIEIKQINDDLNHKQDDFASEAQDTQEEILSKKKACNEAKTERELQTQYKNEEIKGKLACKNRIYTMQQ
jgi:4-alpha-glucanotransferase